MKINLKGQEKEFEKGITPAEIAKSIGMGLYKSACLALVDGEYCDLRTPIEKDCDVQILTFEDHEGKKAFWHTASHMLAQAVLRLYPGTKLAIGPAIDNGFYYDFEPERPFDKEDLEKIEKEMKKICKEGLSLERSEVTPQKAAEIFKDEPYKIELLEKHSGAGENISLYTQGEFVDLCAGPHLMDTSAVKAVKLTSSTGAYWHGDSNLPMLNRIYGTAFPKASQLEEYLAAVEEALKRDHNKIGRELEYFTTSELIGQGLPILMPNGARLFQTLTRWIEDEEEKRGYLLTKTPYMAKSDLYKVSGHWDHYRDGMFIMGDPDKSDEEEVMALRPMTCPFQYQVYLAKKRSYRELPLRYAETSTLFRNEESGEMHGLIRVRQFTISEAHLIVRPEQMEAEFKGVLELIQYVMKTLGFAEDVTYRFSKWDSNDTEKYEGTPEQWEHAQNAMRRILDDIGLEYVEADGEAAFYGPKLDIQYRNVFGKEDTLITLQIDMMVAQKFGMTYTDSDGSEKYPYILHRTSIGCYERTIAMLLEKYAGALPLWMMPMQVKVLPVADRHHEYAYELKEKLFSAGIKVEVDDRSEKIGYKIREAQLQKIPYMILVGDRDIENGTVSVRHRKEGDLGAMKLEEFMQMLQEEIDTKAIK